MADSLDTKFETIDSGKYCGHRTAGQYVIRDNAEWQNLWGKVNSDKIPQPEAPVVNFKEQMVLGVFLGEKNSGGYGIEISSIQETDSCLEVYIKEEAPQPGGAYTTALTQPYHLVKLPLTGKEVMFMI